MECSAGWARAPAQSPARGIHKLSELDRLEDGDILVTNSTDSAWTPAVLVISGVIVETGGVLSHSSCLPREYGFPTIQLDAVCQLIPDGAEMMLSGDTGNGDGRQRGS